MNASLPSNLYLGTQSWSCNDWVGLLYPKGTKSADYIGEYARHFDNQAFGGILSPEVGWLNGGSSKNQSMNKAVLEQVNQIFCQAESYAASRILP